VLLAAVGGCSPPKLSAAPSPPLAKPYDAAVALPWNPFLRRSAWRPSALLPCPRCVLTLQAPSPPPSTPNSPRSLPPSAAAPTLALARHCRPPGPQPSPSPIARGPPLPSLGLIRDHDPLRAWPLRCPVLSLYPALVAPVTYCSRLSCVDDPTAPRGPPAGCGRRESRSTNRFPLFHLYARPFWTQIVLLRTGAAPLVSGFPGAIRAACDDRRLPFEQPAIPAIALFPSCRLLRPP
jgi:hypothetical protein